MQQHLPPIFSCQDLTVAVAGRTLVEHLSLEVSRGELIAVLGQNGSGKSLSLHTLAGLRGAKAGTIRLHESNVAGRHRQQLAKHLALLPQHVDDIFPATVLDTALIGRHPHIGRMSWESQEDLSIARNALKAVDLEDLS
jgi:iron complex transport system ATP-binding protein